MAFRSVVVMGALALGVCGSTVASAAVEQGPAPIALRSSARSEWSPCKARDLPKAVVAAVKESYKDGRINGAAYKKDGAKFVFKLMIGTGEEQDAEMVIDQDGKVISKGRVNEND